MRKIISPNRLRPRNAIGTRNRNTVRRVLPFSNKLLLKSFKGKPIGTELKIGSATFRLSLGNVIRRIDGGHNEVVAKR